MADISDVNDALVARIAQALYPQGTGAPSVVGVPVLVHAGWPTANDLDTDLNALARGHSTGRLRVSVFPTASERVTTRYARDWRLSAPPVPTLTAAINGQTINGQAINGQAINGQQITLGGAVTSPQNVMAMVEGRPYVYAVRPGDTLASVATGLAALIPGAVSAGAVISVPEGLALTAARIGACGTSVQVLRSQERVMQITVWADCEQRRSAVAGVVDLALAQTDFLALPDGTAARLVYRGSPIDDMAQKALLYRRDLLYSVDYATTVSETETQITQTQLNTGVAVAGVGPSATVATLFA